MMRKKIIIIGFAVIMLLTIVGVVIKVNQSNQKPEPAISDNNDPHDHSNTTDEIYVRPIIIDGKELTADQIQNDIMPRARDAALAYVNQSTDESVGDRSRRLAPHFTDNNQIINAPKPSVDRYNTPNTSTTATVVNESWLEKSDNLEATIFLEVVTTTTGESPSEVGRIYQGYDVTMVRTGDTYRASSIVFSNKPLVLRR